MCHYKWYVNLPKKRSLVVGRAPGEQRSAAGRGAAARGPRLMSLSSSSSAVPEKPRRKKDTVLTMLAGGIAGAIEAVATWPVEYIKTQQQQPRKIVVRGGIVSAPQPYKGIVEGLQFNIKTAGFFSVYTGLTPTLILSIPKSSCRFGANAYFRDQLRSADGTLYAGASFVAGLLAGIAEAVLVVTPQETIKTKLISLNMGFQSGVRLIVEREGVAGLYQGGLSTAFKQGGSVSVRFLFMSEYTRWLKGEAEPTRILSRRRWVRVGREFRHAAIRCGEDAHAIHGKEALHDDAPMLPVYCARGRCEGPVQRHRSSLRQGGARLRDHLYERRGHLQPT